MTTLRRICSSLEDQLGALLLVGLCLTVSAQVFSRFVLKDPYTWAEELARLLFIWCVFVGASMAHKHRRHFAIDLLPVRLASCGGRRARCATYLDRAVRTVVALTLLALVWFGAAHAWAVRQSRSDILEISLLWTYLPLPLCALAMTLRTLFGSAPADPRT